MHSKCFVPGCRSGYQSKRKANERAGIKNPCMFSVPKDGQLLEKWKQIIPKSYRELSSKDKVCELHFEEDCIERNFTFLNPDGSLYPIPKGHATLKKDSIPTVFQNLSAYRRKRLAPTPHTCSSENKHRRPGDNLENVINSLPQLNDNLENVINNHPKSINNLESVIDNHPLFNDHLKNITDISPPLNDHLENFIDITPQSNDNLENVMDIPEQLSDNLENVAINTPPQVDDSFKFSVRLKKMLIPSWWSVVCTEDFVMFVKWNSKYYSERRVVIGKDLSIKVFLMDTQVSLPFEKYTVENLTKLLKEVDIFRICHNADSRTSSGCLGYLDGSKRQMFCSSCTKSLKNKKDDERRRMQHSLGTKKRNYLKEIKNIKKRNKRLQNRVSQLKIKLAESKYQCSKENTLLKTIAHLPTEDQIAIKSCFFSSKNAGGRTKKENTWDLTSEDLSMDEFSGDSMSGSEEFLTDDEQIGFYDDPAASDSDTGCNSLHAVE